MRKQPLEIQTLYGELIERLTAYEAGRTIGHLPGGFVTKNVKGETYYYFQYLEPGGGKRQLYVGKKDHVLDAVVARFHDSRRDADEERASIQRLCALLRAGPALITDTASARVLQALSDSGVFHLGGVLVGTHAFIALGNLLGVSWDGTGLRTQDIDIAAERSLDVAIAGLRDTPVPEVLDSLEMGFVPVPGLDPRRPSTSFKVRGKGLRLDLLTPARGRESDGAVEIPRFRAAAQPLRFLDYVIEDATRAAIVDGSGVLVNVPLPARFALHKLLVATARPESMHVKRDKDVYQAVQVLAVLVEERPGDLALAWDAIEARGPGWAKRVLHGVDLVRATEPGLAERITRS